ncbi:aldehyde dehydrogenase family protein [Amphritea sp. HPY]|uniref:aldehyde dehydrogenase family protein n=1 Tax=Amphritea sp. HPY TaxID=3421652 RepID=UPI003D7D59F6
MHTSIKTISPVNGSVYVERNFATKEDIQLALKIARQAQSVWRNVALAERQAICRKAVELLNEEKQQVAEEISWQMGRPIKFAAGEVAGFTERADYMINAAPESLKTQKLEDKEGFIRYIEREPVGVVLVIAPWNYPYLTAVNAFLPALLAGNSVILKHSPQTPLCVERLVRIFSEAGIPEGVFQYLHMDHEGSESVIRSALTNYVAFTGSVPGGAAVERAAAGRFIGVGLELGGKDPSYVRADADIDNAVATLVDGAFFNSGQSCCSIERVYVDQSVYQEFVDKAVKLTNEYVLGSPVNETTTLGPMVSAKAAAFVREQIAEAVVQGAMAHIDESRFPESEVGTAYLAPQILTNVNHDMRVMTEETFGPLMAIMPVSSDEQAVTLMNDSEFGLTASVFSSDIDTAIRLGNKIETGTFFVNRCDYLDPALAWTGVKNSGRGCTLSSLGFDSLTQLKSFHVKVV